MAVAFNAGNITFPANGSTISMSYTCSSGADRLLLVNTLEAGNTTNSGTYAGAALTSVGSVSAVGSFKMWAKTAPATGSNTLSFVLSSYGSGIVNVSDWTGVDQTTPLGTPISNTGTSAAPASGSITVPANGAAFGTSYGSYNSTGTPTAGASTTLVGGVRSSGHPIAGGYITATGNINWNIAQSTAWGAYSVPINPVSAGAAFLAKGLTPISQAIQGMY